LKPLHMHVLKLASNVDVAQYGQPQVGAEALQDIRADVESLIEKVLNTEFPSSDLKEVLLEQLENIRRAIVGYRLSGTKGLRIALDGAVGAILTRPEQMRQSGQHEGSRKTVRDVLEFLANIAQILQLVVLVAQLKGILPPLLGSG
jgi:hypothetical protein